MISNGDKWGNDPLVGELSLDTLATRISIDLLRTLHQDPHPHSLDTNSNPNSCSVFTDKEQVHHPNDPLHPISTGAILLLENKQCECTWLFIDRNIYYDVKLTVVITFLALCNCSTPVQVVQKHCYPQTEMKQPLCCGSQEISFVWIE